MIKIDFGMPDLDSMIQEAVRQQVASTLAVVVCPTHGTRLEGVYISGDAPDRLQINLKGCCDAILSLANRALGSSEEEADDEQESNASMENVAVRPLRAFICHASEDKDLARRLANDLHAAGINTFFDEWEIRAGDSLRRKIDEGIESCTHFIVLLTPTSLEKPWVNAELDAGFVTKLNGQSILIPLRHNLGVDRLPPLLAALLSPEIRAYDEDVKALINDIRGLTRKPPVGAASKQRPPSWGPNLALTPLAAEIAELFAKRSEDGRAWDPQMPVADLKAATDVSDNDLIDAISELEDLGWVEPQRVMGAAPYGYDVVTPTDRLFEQVDQSVMGWNPVQDAVRVAAEVVNSEESGLQAHELIDRLGWTPRRLNPALSYLVTRDLVLSSRANDPVFVTHYVAETSKTRRFVRNAS